MTQLQITVVRFSDSFSDVWGELAQELDAEISVCEDRELAGRPEHVAAVLLAAGGAEHEVLDWLDENAAPPGVPLFAVGSDPSRRMGTQIVGRGATDYFALPEDIELLRNRLGTAVERRAEDRRRAATYVEEPGAEAFSEIIGQSNALREVLARAARILRHPDTTVLIVGETGTGKELLAKAIHDGSPRRGLPFVPVNCSALPDHLIESELFGHERGAFTDAHAAKPGLFEVADGGTLFLDEIGTLPSALQAKLLRVLQDNEVRRVGGTKTRRVDVQIMAATNEDLRQALRTGAFRQDLFFRLGVITLALPPLRDRGDDVILIAATLLERLAHKHGLPVPPVRPEIRRVLLGYPWPGNVRELKNAVERALLLSPPGKLLADELLPPGDMEARGSGPIPFPADLDEITAAAARATVDLFDGNRSEAARRLGISRQRLRRLLDLNRLTA